MSKFRNYVFTAAGLVILAGAFTVIGPYVDLGHSKPPPSVTDVNVVNTPLPVVVENGDAPETLVITIVEDVTHVELIEFDAVDVSGFRFVAFHSTGRAALLFRFSTQAGRFNDDIPKTSITLCSLTVQGADCPSLTGLAASIAQSRWAISACGAARSEKCYRSGVSQQVISKRLREWPIFSNCLPLPVASPNQSLVS